MYFGYVLWKGALGVESLQCMIQKSLVLEKQINRLEEEKNHLEQRIFFLNTHISKPLLEENVKSHLGYIDSKEYIIFDY